MDAVQKTFGDDEQKAEAERAVATCVALGPAHFGQSGPLDQAAPPSREDPRAPIDLTDDPDSTPAN